MPILENPRHEAFAQGLARGSSAAAAYVEAGYKPNCHNAAALARKQRISTRANERRLNFPAVWRASGAGEFNPGE
jgi:phage terminase small subunit